MTNWCEAWPEELKEAERRRYRAECKLRCLTAALDRVDPAEFDGVMARIEAARDELHSASRVKLDMLWKFEYRQWM